MPQRHCAGHDERRGHQHLQPAQAEQPVAHVPKRAGRQFQTDQEQHHDDAKFGKVLKVFRLGPDQSGQRADDDPCGEIPQNRPQPQARSKRDRDNRSTQIDCRLKQKAFHGDLYARQRVKRQ